MCEVTPESRRRGTCHNWPTAAGITPRNVTRRDPVNRCRYRIVMRVSLALSGSSASSQLSSPLDDTSVISRFRGTVATNSSNACPNTSRPVIACQVTSPGATPIPNAVEANTRASPALWV